MAWSLSVASVCCECQNYGDAALIKDHRGTEPGRCVFGRPGCGVCVFVTCQPCQSQAEGDDEGLRFLRSFGPHSSYHDAEERNVSGFGL